MSGADRAREGLLKELRATRAERDELRTALLDLFMNGCAGCGHKLRHGDGCEKTCVTSVLPPF